MSESICKQVQKLQQDHDEAVALAHNLYDQREKLQQSNDEMLEALKTAETIIKNSYVVNVKASILIRAAIKNAEKVNDN